MNKYQKIIIGIVLILMAITALIPAKKFKADILSTGIRSTHRGEYVFNPEALITRLLAVAFAGAGLYFFVGLIKPKKDTDILQSKEEPKEGNNE